MKQIIKNFVFGFLFLFAFTATLTGCSSSSDKKDSASTEVTAEATETTSETNTDTDSQSSEEAADTAETTTAEAKDTVYPLTVSNFSIKDGTWEAKKQTFQEAPSKVVATTQPTAELLIRLGLTDKMAGVAALYGDTPDDIAGEFAKIPVLSKDYVSKEPVLGADPDLIIGRGDLFADAEWGVGTINDLNGLGINTYVLNTCQSGATIDALYKDIATIGEIFNVQAKAAEFSASLHERETALKNSITNKDEIKTYAYVNIQDGAVSVYSGSTDTFQNSVLNLINLDNAFKDAAGEINLEEFISTDPDILLISYYAGGPDPDEIINELYAMPSIQSMKAIKNKQAYVIDYNQFWAYGYQIFDGVEKLGSEVYAQ